MDSTITRQKLIFIFRITEGEQIMNNNNQDTVIFADLLSDEVVYLCRRLDKSLYICTVAEDEHGFYEKNAKNVSITEARIFAAAVFNQAMSEIG